MHLDKESGAGEWNGVGRPFPKETADPDVSRRNGVGRPFPKETTDPDVPKNVVGRAFPQEKVDQAVSAGNGSGHDEILVAVRDAVREACHLAALAGRTVSAEEESLAAREASLGASRAVFALEDALRNAGRARPTPVAEALAALIAAESALAAARHALERDVSRTLRPAGPARERHA